MKQAAFAQAIEVIGLYPEYLGGTERAQLLGRFADTIITFVACLVKWQVWMSDLAVSVAHRCSGGWREKDLSSGVVFVGLKRAVGG